MPNCGDVCASSGVVNSPMCLIPYFSLLAALAPSLGTLPTLSSVLRTWEDQLWARVSALLEERVDTLLEHYRTFWTKLDESGWDAPQNEQNEEGDDAMMHSASHHDISDDTYRHDVRSSLAELRNTKLSGQ